MNWFFGVDKIKITGDVIKILNLLEYHNIECMKLKTGDNYVKFSLLRMYTPKLNSIDFENCSLEITSRRGLPQLCLDYICRPGMVVGSLIFVVCMLFYGSFVFDIKINGNDRLSEKYVLDALKSQNFTVGSYIPKVDFDRISNEICIEYGDISWMFINMMGNVAYVEMHEYKNDSVDEDSFPSDSKTDLVATEDGQIYRFEVSSGIVKISIGETALKGDILVSGWEKGEKADYYGRSQGMVFAKTYHELTVNLPREIEVSEVEEKKEFEKWIEILGFRINLSKKGSNFDTSCDIIEESSKLTLPGGAELPVVLTKRYAVKKTVKKVTLTDDELEQLANEKMAEKLAQTIKQGEILSMQRNDTIDESGYVALCNVYCIKNIAKEVKAERTEEPKEKHQDN